MSATTKYLLVSLPTSISPSNDREEAQDALRANVNDHGRVSPFSIPELKMGTLDALVQQADDLAKLGPACDGVVSKIAEALSSILGGDQDKIAQQKAVNDSGYPVVTTYVRFCPDKCLPEPLDQYLQNFSWNRMKYRADRSLPELARMLQDVRCRLWTSCRF